MIPNFLVIAILSIPVAVAGPACTRKYFQSPDCVEQCRGNWGYPGALLGSDRWGAVIAPAQLTLDNWDNYVSIACGLGPSVSGSSNSGVAGAAESTPSVTSSSVPSSIASTASTSTSSSTAIATATGLSNSISTAQITTTSSTTQVHSTTTKATATTTTTSSKAIFTTKYSSTGTTSTTASAQKSSASTVAVSSGTSSSDIAAYLKGHNDARAAHGASPLTWSDSLAATAQVWASGCLFKHSGGPFGENLAAGVGGGYGIPDAIASWVNEASSYNPSNPQASHFTQVVWKSTTQVGCAVRSCNGIFDPSFGAALFYVCEYDPPGNVDNEFAENVQV